MIRALTNARILEDGGLAEAKLVEDRAVLIEDGRIKAVVGAREVPADARRTDLEGALLLPGFFDTQVNGGAGLLFNDAPTVETIAAIGAAHRKFGTTAFLPTLISDDLEVVREAIAAVDAAIAQGVPGVWGIHIEGPFLNVRRKGVHDASKFLTLDESSLGLLSSLKRGRTLVTLAPEKTRPGIVRALADAGVVVSAGHANASYAATKAALEHGLTGFTHLFNAMSPLTSREPGVVGAALENQSAWCGLIVDGRHVDPVVLRIALKCRPLDRFMLVTDAMPSVGMKGSKTFMLQGRMITVEDGVCVDAHGTLAGSDLDMASAVRNACAMLDLDLASAARMAGASPARFMGLEREFGRIAPGLRADLVAADDDLKVIETWIGGEASGDLDAHAPEPAAAFGGAARGPAE
ncbi:MAG TPA: N-acetylglucosamine-6-phosphate deacetylase [Caulobacteraceae bacterium]|jgi:N-acetylglucosamine-6-phosphate deacetylase|nr:N-acetylglucosamine-6-phosphate deacetylase [Caulobacteraceae bacterium]